MANEKEGIRFDRNEISGAFGDIGTDLPLIVGMIAACRLDPASTLIVFGAFQILTGVIYRMPMPVQPLKAVAVLMISNHYAPEILYGGGLAIGVLMLLLTVTGFLSLLARTIPKAVVRGIQFGLGLQLCFLATKDYIPAPYFSDSAVPSFILAGAGFVIGLLLLGNKRLPPAIPLIGLGIAFAFIFRVRISDFGDSFGFAYPKVSVPDAQDIWKGFLLLALAQIPLSIGNSVLATTQCVKDFFPDRSVGVKKIGFTYSLMNITSPFLGGIPVCHGSGGIAGHYVFGGRTGGSVIIYGGMYLVLGLFFSRGFGTIVNVFPLPILGVILLFEGLTLISLLKDLERNEDTKHSDFFIAILVGIIAAGIPYGYAVGLATGWILHGVFHRR